MVAQFLDRAKLDRRSRAGLGTRRHQTVALAVVTQRTLVGMTIEVAARDDAEGAGCHAVGAAVADVGLDVNIREFIVDDRPGRTGLLAGRRDAMFANIAHHQPAAARRTARNYVQRGPAAFILRGELFNEFHMAPCRGGQCLGVVVAIAAPGQAIGWQLIPLLAGHLASFAANTHRGVGVKAHGSLRRRGLAALEGSNNLGDEVRKGTARRSILSLGHSREFQLPTCGICCHGRNFLQAGPPAVCQERVCLTANWRASWSVQGVARHAGQPRPGRRKLCLRAC